MPPPRLSPATQLSLLRTPGVIPARGDVTITLGVGGHSLIVEAFDLDGTPQIRTEIALAYYDQQKVDQFTASWRHLMAKRAGNGLGAAPPDAAPLSLVP